MTTKLLASTLLAASLLAAPAIAFAQSDSTSKPASTEAKPMASTEAKPMTHKMRHHAMLHHARTHHFGAGTTTGMSVSPRSRPGGESISRNPAY